MSWPPCWRSDYDASTMVHENGHNLGAVQDAAPGSSGAAHCDGYGNSDWMCYTDGGPYWDSSLNCLFLETHYDVWHDSYFDAAPEAREWFPTHWNIGANTRWTTFNVRFIRFS